MVLSSWSTSLLEGVASCSASGLKWLQMDILKHLDLVTSLVKRAELQGYKAIVLTVDIPFFGIRHSARRSGFKLPSHLSFENVKSLFEDVQLDKDTFGTVHDPSVTWDIIGWFRTITELPIVVKGILTAEDAKPCCPAWCRRYPGIKLWRKTTGWLYQPL